MHLAAGKQGVLQDSTLGASTEVMVEEGAPHLLRSYPAHLALLLWEGTETVPRVPWGAGAGSAQGPLFRQFIPEPLG